MKAITEVKISARLATVSRIAIVFILTAFDSVHGSIGGNDALLACGKVNLQHIRYARINCYLVGCQIRAALELAFAQTHFDIATVVRSDNDCRGVHYFNEALYPNNEWRWANVPTEKAANLHGLLYVLPLVEQSEYLVRGQHRSFPFYAPGASFGETAAVAII
jgi:hypothetical protein